jgi:hypothetical protein
VTDMSPLGRYVVSSTAGELKHDLECLRLASDFMQLSRDTLDPDLRAHCVRMATYWHDRAGSGPLHNPVRADGSEGAI